METVLILILILGFVRAAIKDQETKTAKEKVTEQWCQDYRARQVQEIMEEERKKHYE